LSGPQVPGLNKCIPWTHIWPLAWSFHRCILP
jgi:hypothetical protein